ncbi:ParB family protein [Caviibacterium pharyngocola]|uniref:Chromosome partitioning protein ParB n=1 Tax=Caviibacterium pharyngocola TaxID=28159 RepID=A0A2M8RSR0_9PAST|nr:ParB family protein [Caviibacterium pharyngocola]PJG81924.1 chromosome partitioning protein ParB [Caviibacterium pharyngocola]
MTDNKKLIRNKKDEARMNAIARGLNVAPMSAQAAPQPETLLNYPSNEQYITVTLDKLRPYEHNPRKTRNPNFEAIKESIRRRGLDHKPNITRRPGEDFYIIADGGNTRIQALKELFTETQDTRFWSISCHYKPWKGEYADSVEAELDLLIGHLIENDTRADLSFIEKALGILQAKEYYEKKLTKELSARDLSTQLEIDGYIISHALILKMERCVKYLYPFIPNVLFSGLGHTQIDKLLSIRNNADQVWHKYQLDNDNKFIQLWGDSLALCNDDQPFHIKTFQDHLITAILDELGEDATSYEALHLDIDLDEQKFRKLAAKQQELDQKIAVSQSQSTEIAENQPAPKTVQAVEKTAKSTKTVADINPNPTSSVILTPAEEVDDFVAAFDTDDTSNIQYSQQSANDNITETQSTESLTSDFNTALSEHFINDFGLVPGMSVQAQREQKAQENGLSFALTGRQPVADIWQIFPARKHKAEAYSLALDIAESVQLDEWIEHVVKNPVDYSFRMKTVPITLNASQQAIYDLLAMLETDELSQNKICQLNTALLLGNSGSSPIIDDITLVKIFRLIRLVRHIRASN